MNGDEKIDNKNKDETETEDEKLKEEFLESYRKQRQDNRIQLAMANAMIIAGITFLSTMSIEFPPTMQNIWAASIAALLALLTQLKSITEIIEKPKRPLGMLI